MTIIQSFFLSIIEGLTEFLPVSSTGHLILAGKLLRIPDTEFYRSFEIIIQLGAILAVVLLYWQKILKEKYLWPKIIVAFLPSALFGFLFYKSIKLYLLGNTQVVLWSLFIGGLALLLVEFFLKKKISYSPRHSLSEGGSNSPSPRRSPEEYRDEGGLKSLNTPNPLNLKNCFFIGLFQVLSLVPGVSRSAATIIGGLTIGLSRKEAVEFSFLLAIPTMFAAGGYDILKNYQIIMSGNLKLLIVGFIGSFITALFAIKFFINYVQKHDLLPFALYRILLAIIYYLSFRA